MPHDALVADTSTSCGAWIIGTTAAAAIPTCPLKFLPDLLLTNMALNAASKVGAVAEKDAVVSLHNLVVRIRL